MTVSAQAEPTTQPPATGTILVVDDDDDVRETIVEIIKYGGHTCVPVSNVADALKEVQSRPIDVILTDMHMPNASGLDLIERMQTLNDTIPVILVTGYPSVQSAVNALKRGAVEFISKPFDIASITQVVSKALREHSMRIEVKRLQEESHKLETIEKLNRRLQSRVEELTKLYSISDGLSQNMDTDALFERVVKLASEVTGASRVTLMMLDRGRRFLQIRASVGVPAEVITTTRVKMGQGVSGKVAQERQLIRTTRRHHESYASQSDTLGLGLYSSQSWLSVPMLVAGQVFGVLNLTDKPDRADFTEEEEHVIQSLVEKAGTKLENQALYEGIYASMIDTLNSLVTTIEAKDPYTRMHSHRVTEYAMRLARKIGRSESEIEMIEFAGVLHDIGKIGVRDEILTKDGKLTDEEYEGIKMHVTIGEKIVEPLGLSADERSIIRNHHERFDGEGYPDHLRGDGIPILTRVTSIADAFDAMTSTRPYRKALSAHEAIREFQKHSGKQFDPDIIASMVDALEKGEISVLTDVMWSDAAKA